MNARDGKPEVVFSQFGKEEGDVLFHINLFAAARLGDVLTAKAHEVNRAGRTGVYDIAVTNQRGERIAAFRGRSHTMKGKPLVEGLPIGKAPGVVR